MKSKDGGMKALRIILWVYIILCVIIASLNYGYAPRADAATARFLTWFWHFYENWVKTAFIIVASILTLKHMRKSGRTALRKQNLIGFVISALIVHIVLPLASGNNEWYFFTMPLPWTTTPLQLLDGGTAFYLSRIQVWGAAGVAGVLVFYGIATLLIFVGTLCLDGGCSAPCFACSMASRRRCLPLQCRWLAMRASPAESSCRC